MKERLEPRVPFVYESSAPSEHFRNDDLELPLTTSVREYAGSFCSRHKLPAHLREDVEDRLARFVDDVSDQIYEEQSSKCIDRFFDTLNGVSTTVDRAAVIHEAADQWNARANRSRARPVDGNDDSVFGEVYRAVLHQADGARRILQKEKQLRVEMQELLGRRDVAVEQAVKMSDIPAGSPADRLTVHHLDTIQSVEATFESKIASLAASQRAELRSFVIRMHEAQLLSDEPDRTSVGNGQDAPGDAATQDAAGDRGRPKLDESFTIYLGAQMKTMHNLRLVATDPSFFCNHHAGGARQSSDDHDSRRLQMSLNLYSESLSGMVLLVGPKLGHHSSMKTAFSLACEQSTELHFACLSAQQFNIRDNGLCAATEWRLSRCATQVDEGEADHTVSFDVRGTSAAADLQVGDVYVTRHSNLAQVHVVFHMVEDDVLKTQDITSRHVCINGLRNIIRMCVQFGITTVTLPLLLVTNMAEEMTVAWCLKRAELVFKCVKGFIIESVTLCNPRQNIAVQFVLPPETSPSMFQELSDMLLHIFHVVGPVVGS